MPYLKLSLPALKSQFQVIERLLETAGALSITTTDAEDVPILEPAPGETPLWQHIIITALFPEDASKTALQDLFPDAKLERLAEEDWERAWLKDYTPIQFDQALWVGPQDFTPPSDVKTVLFLDPGLAFGTGTHPTTFLCLEWLSRHTLAGKSVLDFGCGSGILALAALKLGAAQTIGIDIDPQALVASEENAARNAIEPHRCDWRLAVDAPATKVDVLLANILANPLIEGAPRLLGFLKEEGIIVLSGILEEQAEPVKAAYLPHITWESVTVREGWTRLVGKRNPRL